MRIQDDITLSIAKAVADVLEGKKPAVEVSDPEAKGEKDFKDKHDIKKSGEKEDGTVVKEAPFSPTDVKKAVEVAMKMSGNMTGAVKEIEGIKKGLSKDPEVKDALQLANESFDMIHSEALEMNISIEEASKKLGYTDVEEGEELSPKQKKYQDFFLKALKKFGATSPADLDVEKKKEFFDYIDKNYESEADVD